MRSQLRRGSIPLPWIPCLAVLLLTGCADGAEPSPAEPPVENRAQDRDLAAFEPADGHVLFIVGQDLASVREYSASDCCPVPGGVTTYLGLFKVLDEAQQFGGMGIDPEGKPLDEMADWGAGISSLYHLMQEYPESALAIGLSITENEHPGAMARLIAGEYDTEIAHLAGLLAQHPLPVYLRIGYEFDGLWNAGYGDRGQYIAAYRRVVDQMRDAGVDNIATVWQASASPTDDSIEGVHEDLTEWYPGDDYVDWMGISWFLRPDVVGPESAVEITQRALADELLELARKHRKPVMIAESTPLAYDLTQGHRARHSPVWDGVPHTEKVELDGEAIWNEWFAPYFAYIHANDDVIKAVAYINAHWDAQAMWSANDYASGYWGDSRVQQNPKVLEHWLTELGGEHWIAGGPGLAEALGAQ